MIACNNELYQLVMIYIFIYLKVIKITVLSVMY
ncbi:MAG: hypothetical protein CENE_02093 [Candidatus Celerinatantimonas neptuna]|nr:MAG: hypothetical protein CENE_02093 [Candidatus Celerinatantimonas neptuna]